MTENGKVTIVADQNGSVIRVSKNNPEFGHVRLTQEKVGFGSNGWVKRANRSTLIHGTVEDLQAMGIANKKELKGQIIIKEQFDPFSDSNSDRDLKIAGDTEIVCLGTNTDTGEIDCPIYRKTFYSMDLDQPDVTIAHTNGKAIKDANNTDSEKVTITPEQLDEINNSDEEKPKTRRKKADKQETQVDLEDSIQEIKEEEVEEVEVEVEETGFNL